MYYCTPEDPLASEISAEDLPLIGTFSDAIFLDVLCIEIFTHSFNLAFNVKMQHYYILILNAEFFCNTLKKNMHNGKGTP